MKNKKLSILANHSYPHVGGVETIIKLLAEKLNSKYGVSVDVYSRSLEKDIKYNNINYISVKSYPQLRDKLLRNKYDHNFIYSDHFKFFPEILNDYYIIPGFKSIALVGMYRSYSDGKILKQLLKRKDELGMIVHSEYYQDYELCKSLNLPVNVIHNGIDFDEFRKNNISFRKKYKIKENNIILCVSNFFPGKGQEHLVEVLKKIKNKLDDYIMVFISSTVNFRYAQLLSKRVQQMLIKNNINHLFLTDISRQDTIAAYNDARVFVTASCKEVAPVCILEAMASKTPWVAFPVGNIPSLSGGIVIPCEKKNIEGYLEPDACVLDNYGSKLIQLLSNDFDLKKYAISGYSEVLLKYNWETIVGQYYKLFFAKNQP